MNRKDIQLSLHRWIASVALASTILISGCASSGNRISWNPWESSNSIVVDSMNSMKNATSQFAEFAHLKKKAPATTDQNVAGHAKVDELQLQEGADTTERPSLGKTFAAWIGKAPKKEVIPKDPFLAETHIKLAEQEEKKPAVKQTETRVVSSEKPVKETFPEQEKDPFIEINPRQSRVERLRKEVMAEQIDSPPTPSSLNRDNLYRQQVNHLMTTSRLFLKNGKNEQALATATEAMKISEKQSLFFKPNEDDPRALVRHIREEMATSQWSSAANSESEKEIKPADPFLQSLSIPPRNDALNNQTLKFPTHSFESEKPRLSFEPDPEMIIESRSVPSRNQTRLVHRTEQSHFDSINQPTPDEQETLKVPTIPQQNINQYFEDQPEEKNNSGQTRSQIVNPFDQFEETSSSTSQAQMPVLGVTQEQIAPSAGEPFLAPPPPEERLTDADFTHANSANESHKTSGGPSFLFSGDQIAANEQEATHLNSESSLPPMPAHDGNTNELDGGAFSSWKSSKIIGIAVVLLLLLGFVAWRKTTPPPQETA